MSTASVITATNHPAAISGLTPDVYATYREACRMEACRAAVTVIELARRTGRTRKVVRRHREALVRLGMWRWFGLHVPASVPAPEVTVTDIEARCEAERLRCWARTLDVPGEGTPLEAEPPSSRRMRRLRAVLAAGSRRPGPPPSGETAAQASRRAIEEYRAIRARRWTDLTGGGK